MKTLTILSLAALAFILPACTTVHNDPPSTSTTSTETTETQVRAPIGSARTSTTVRSY